MKETKKERLRKLKVLYNLGGGDYVEGLSREDLEDEIKTLQREDKETKKIKKERKKNKSSSSMK